MLLLISFVKVLRLLFVARAGTTKLEGCFLDVHSIDILAQDNFFILPFYCAVQILENGYF